MAIVDRMKWDGSAHLLAWKFPPEELSTWTQLIVNETQEAFVVRGGVYEARVFVFRQYRKRVINMDRFLLANPIHAIRTLVLDCRIPPS